MFNGAESLWSLGLGLEVTSKGPDQSSSGLLACPYDQPLEIMQYILRKFTMTISDFKLQSFLECLLLHVLLSCLPLFTHSPA